MEEKGSSQHLINAVKTNQEVEQDVLYHKKFLTFIWMTTKLL
jgi:hypothetical protein